jgi:hypothetical protein
VPILNDQSFGSVNGWSIKPDRYHVSPQLKINGKFLGICGLNCNITLTTSVATNRPRNMESKSVCSQRCLKAAISDRCRNHQILFTHIPLLQEPNPIPP